MNQEMLVRYLDQYSPIELFYHAHSAKISQPEEFLELLNASNPEALRRSCVLPEYSNDSIPRLLLNPGYSDSMGQRHVRLVRHCRCIPEFSHTHNYFEILYVLRGSCRHQTESQTCLLREGDLLLVSPSVCHSVHVDSHDLVICILICGNTIENLFSSALRGKDSISDFLRNAIFQKDYASWLLFHTAGDEEIRRQILDMYLEEFQTDEYADRIIASMLSVFFIRLVRKYKRTVEVPVSNPPVHSETAYILQYLQENYATASLSELSKKLNYSVPHCSKYIKARTGQSFSQLQKQIRFQKAADYLQNTNMSIEWISERVGYANPENFMRMFKQICGISPSQFRSGRQSGIQTV